MTHDVVWWEIETPDPAGARAFYGALFGWTFERAFDGPGSELGRDYWLIRRGDGDGVGRGIGGLQAALPGQPAPAAGVRLYVRVDDLEATVARAVALGAVSERGRTLLGGDDHWFANVRDPQGISLGLWTSRPAA
ncbi:VOC family protein [Jiangella mangrovi]|uniref:Putative enzyme related to lactoylglutathione lyase n=1 Tax=Jiangella mangrovi TaxID=1524084 RepID=A0A7W9GUE2_9ACTN|nr:VOC family protein [Jiangella mangrovi]MBB5789969.1 putative enzyme related to lactoylglutathione lyase [Jiangella mangrovi]